MQFIAVASNGFFHSHGRPFPSLTFGMWTCMPLLIAHPIATLVKLVVGGCLRSAIMLSFGLQQLQSSVPPCYQDERSPRNRLGGGGGDGGEGGGGGGPAWPRKSKAQSEAKQSCGKIFSKGSSKSLKPKMYSKQTLTVLFLEFI